MKQICEMRGKCENCGKEMNELHLTHCSELCIFENLKKSKKFGDPKNSPDYPDALMIQDETEIE